MIVSSSASLVEETALGMVLASVAVQIDSDKIQDRRLRVPLHLGSVAHSSKQS